jgi:acyl-coenzyme A thioesterase PaaI-like protein
LRNAVEASVATLVDAGELRAAADQVRAVTERLSAARRGMHQLPALDDPVAFRRVYNPVTGVGSAIAPPIVIQPENGGVVGRTTVGLAYEGPPGYLHGGMSALFMDQLLGAAAVAAGLWGMTAHLELDYRRPVPLLTPLVLRAGVTEDAGRKTTVRGTIALEASPDEPLVQACGVFVMPSPEKSEAYFSAITDAAGRAAPPQRPTDATALQAD